MKLTTNHISTQDKIALISSIKTFLIIITIWTVGWCFLSFKTAEYITCKNFILSRKICSAYVQNKVTFGPATVESVGAAAKIFPKPLGEQ